MADDDDPVAWQDLGARYRSIFEQHPHAVFGLDLEGRFTEVNPAAGQISGYDADQLLSMNFAELIEPDDLERALAAFTGAAQRVPQRLEISIRKADGDLADVDVTGIPLIVNDEVVGLFGVVEDITARNRIVRELEVTRQLAESASDVKADFVARMSHEIRTPLTGILATTELLANSDPPPELQPLVNTLFRSSRRLAKLLDNVLDFAAADLEVGRPSASEEFDLHLLIHDAVDLADASARLKGLRVGLDLADDVPRRVRDHPTWTSQVLTNLLSNAVAFTETGRVDLSVSTTRTARSGDAILYRVSDTGIGIDPAYHDLVFQPFDKTPSAHATSRGAGLGLSIVKQLVTISGGSIALDSAPGRGSTFSVVLPVRPVAAPAS